MLPGVEEWSGNQELVEVVKFLFQDNQIIIFWVLASVIKNTITFITDQWQMDGLKLLYNR